MNEKTDTEIISRRRAIWMLGVAAAFGMAMPAAVLTASEADAQTAGMERRQGRRENRRDRREDRRDNRQDRRTDRRENRQDRRDNRRGASQ
jgi:Ni/Co efflux regulator RcnB